MELSLLETRVIGALIEKELTTPDQYPLSLNGLATACNQKSNREPVLSLSESEVQEVLDQLKSKNLASEVLIGGRVPKYKHRFCNTEFSKLHLNPQELGVICVMFLRGPQTPGELRTRTNRLCKFDDSLHVEKVLQRLIDREDGPFVIKMQREAGKRESRYAHLFSGEVNTAAAEPAKESDVEIAATVGYVERIETLEGQVASLREELEHLKAMLGE
ncbi:hypothetical protein TDB9533_03638 [Thalassocella blandensis]|nr:hypothetical protein TDB9533_03638 [Thalassocella blandensis]